MQYILSLVFAAMLVVAQTSWKRAVDAAQSPFHGNLSVSTFVRFIFSPLVLLGIVIYALAVFLYMYLLSKYQFSLIQSMVIPTSLIFSIFVAVTLFGESLSYVNYSGLFFIVLGIVLINMH